MKWISERPINRLLERLSVSEVLVLHNKGTYDKLVEWTHVPECFEDFMNEELLEDIERFHKLDDLRMQPYIGAVTDTLYFNYDFGDDWYVKITGSCGATDLVESGRIRQEELDEAVTTVCTKHRPVCIAQDGLSVLDDVGGYHGFLQFLRGINQKGRKRLNEADDAYKSGWCEEYGPFVDKQDSLEWAKSLGWSRRKVSNKNLL